MHTLDDFDSFVNSFQETLHYYHGGETNINLNWKEKTFRTVIDSLCLAQNHDAKCLLLHLENTAGPIAMATALIRMLSTPNRCF